MPDSDQERLAGAIATFANVGIAGAALGIPVLVLVAVDGPQWLTIGYILVMTVALIIVIVRGRSRT